MKDKKSFAFVDEFLSSGRWTVVVAGWGLGIFETKESAEHCARDINQAHADGIKEAETCRESGGTDSVCLKGHEDSMKEVRERERKAVAERDARIAALEKELSEWKESARVEAEEGDRARARIAELEKALEKHNKMHGEWTLILLSDGRVTNIPGFETEEACVCAGKNILLHWNWPYVKFVCVNTNGNVKGDR